MRNIIFLATLLFVACQRIHQSDEWIDRAPEIYPDYADITLPPNIAPPNLRITEQADDYQVEMGVWPDGDAMLVAHSDDGAITLPMDDWRALATAATGRSIYIRVTLLRDGRWIGFRPIRDSISPHPIDPYLTYRLIYPGYELWNEMGIYQRDLTTYDESPIIENSSVAHGCVNCHTVANHDAQTMMLHVRGRLGGTVIRRNGRTVKVTPSVNGSNNGATYPSWHPSGRFIAFSANEVQQFFHREGQKAIEVADLSADLMIYDVERDHAVTDSIVCGDQYMETFPTWSPDGRTLYFCRARQYVKGTALDSIRYDLCSVRFDEATMHVDSLRVLYHASDEGFSATLPRISPDGRWLMFTRSCYGCFPIWHPESQLCLMDLATGDIRTMDEVNSDDVDSFHDFSSDGHWFVFSSKRLDGLWARPFIAAFDPATGRATRPFLLPQQSPDFYDTFTRTYNLPTLVTTHTSPVRAE